MSGKMDCCGLSDVGLARSSNQDQYLIADLSKSMRVHQTSLDLDPESTLFGNSQGKLLLVADGMGGHAAGEQASRLVVEVVTKHFLNSMSWFHRLDADAEANLLDELDDAAHECQARLLDDAASRPERTGMGTTLTLAYVIWPHLHLVHIGDSRCYLYRGSQLRQLTTDHTVAQSLIDAGTSLKADVASSPLGNMLWNVIGGEKGRLEPQTSQQMLQLGDTVLLCTDGLTRHVSDELLQEILALNLTASQTCDLLVAAANDAGGLDNITLVVARFLGSCQESALEMEASADVDLEGETTIMQMPALNASAVESQTATVIDRG